MKKVKSRATSALILAALLIVGIVVYIIDVADHGGEWVMYSANQDVYTDGVLTTGTLTDRNGVVLAHAGGGTYYYADDQGVRVSCLHAVGDYAGNIGTGALTQFADKLSGYSLLTGVRKNGGTVKLTIDSTLCNTASAALAGRRGAVIVMNYLTGEIVCMTSTPTYDPNKGFDASNSAYDGAYINRCISSTFTPGSVFKLITVAAAIENIPDLDGQSYYCGGSLAVGSDKVNCTGTHGTQTVEQALANSCNCAFAQISLDLGSDVIAQYAKKFGFTDSLSFNGIPTKAGSFETAEAGSSNLAWSGIGQYKDLISPYAMMRYVAAIANGGSVHEPTLLPNKSAGTTELLKASTAKKIAEMMSYDVTYSYGTGTFPGLKMCAKSGTAELGDGTNNAWFTGFLDDAEHPYAFAVVIENSGGGLKNAGAVANSVLQAAVKEK